jgi:alkyl hydroperoxide reductase subunit AhpC
VQKLEEHFDGQDMVCIRISVDEMKAYESWDNMVREQELGGIQLYADNSFDSEFIKAYGIRSIPRFIMVDKEGNIYDDKALSPSFENTKVLLEALLK